MTASEALIVSHGEDVDGVVAATLLSQYLDEKGQDNSYVFADFNTIENILIEVSENNTNPHRDLYVLDMGVEGILKKEKNGVPLIDRLMEVTNSITLIDHHYMTPTPGLEDDLEDKGVNLMATDLLTCTSKLVYENYIRDQLFPYYLSRLAQLSDHPEEKDRFSQAEWNYTLELQDLITGFNYFDVNSGVSGIADDMKKFPFILSPEHPNYQFYHEQLIFIQDHKEKAVQEFRGSLRTVDLGFYGKERIKIVVGYGSGILPSKGTTRRMMQVQEDLGLGLSGVMVVYGPPTNNVLFFSTPESPLDVIGFCLFMGGGGRGNDGGFSASAYQGDAGENMDDFVEFIKTKLSEFLKSS